MLKIWLIRHGKTAGNTLNRYIGTTDEPLCEEGRELLYKMSYPVPDSLYVSPMKRCVETAGILFPDKRVHFLDELKECNFGEFENKNYKELAGNSHYQEWIDSGGMLPFPGGESREEFKKRCIKGFQKAVTGCIREQISSAALVIHGGSIMNIMEEYGGTDRSFYQWHVKNGGGYEVELNPENWMKGRRELILCTAVMEG